MHMVLRNRVHHRERGTIPGIIPANTMSAVIADRELGIKPGLNPLQVHRDFCDGQYALGRSYVDYNPTLRD